MSAATDALVAYGYVFDGDQGLFVKPGRATQSWKPVKGGFERYDSGVKMPLKVREDATVQSGLSHDSPGHAEHFEWLWPEEEVERIYAHAIEQAAG